MTKRLTSKQKEEITKIFIEGETIDVLSQKFGCTKLTITRNLKKILGEKRYIDLLAKNKSLHQISIKNITPKNQLNNFELDNILSEKSNEESEKTNFVKDNEEDQFVPSPFLEIAPLDLDIDKSSRKELSSVPISEINFPKSVYMIVDKKIELEIKLLKDFPAWGFLPHDDLNRKTIEIYFDVKSAKRICTKEQKVIKVPNTDVFRIVAPILISRGISRIVSEEKLIAL